MGSPAPASSEVMPAAAESLPQTVLPDFAAIEAAAARIAPYVVRTPVLRNPQLDRLAGAELVFKCENLQRGGAFKFRGACNAVFSLDAVAAVRGIATQSSGNHGTAIALAAAKRGVPAYVVVPRNAPAIKLAQIREAGADIIFCEPSMASRDAESARVVRETGAEFVHPFDDARVVAGQGTATLELLREVGSLDAVLAPVSGGGLVSGTALAAHGIDPAITVFAAEPEQAADAYESLRQNRRITDMVPNTFCDGLRSYLGRIAFEVLRRERVEILLATEAEIVAAMRLIWERLKVVVEPSCAVPLAVVLKARERFAGKRIGIVLSGGNVDLERLPWQP
jgi:threonine dehydratase